MDHERYPDYFESNRRREGGHTDTSLPVAFFNAIDILRRMLSRDPERVPSR